MASGNGSWTLQNAGSYVGEHSERKYRKQRHLWPPPHMANKVPRVASSWSMAQHHLLAETKSPVLLKSTSSTTRLSSKTTTTSKPGQVQQHPIQEKATTPNSNKPATAPQKRNLYQGKSNRRSSSESAQTLGSFEEFELMNWQKPRVGKFNSFIIIQIS